MDHLSSARLRVRGVFGVRKPERSAATLLEEESDVVLPVSMNSLEPDPIGRDPVEPIEADPVAPVDIDPVEPIEPVEPIDDDRIEPIDPDPVDPIEFDRIEPIDGDVAKRCVGCPMPRDDEPLGAELFKKRAATRPMARPLPMNTAGRRRAKVLTSSISSDTSRSRS